MIVQNDSYVYDREDTFRYIDLNNCTKCPFDGPTYFVGRTTSETRCIHENMEDEGIMPHLIVARFVTALTRTQRREFTLILNLIRKLYMYKKKGTRKYKESDKDITSTF